MGMQLNTGATGQQVTAEDDGSLYSNIFGNGCYVLESGNQFKAEIQNNNRIKIYDGDALMQGRHVIIHANDSDVVIINNGTSKKNRKDLITIRYIKGNDGVEDAYLNVIQGTEVDGVPAAPEHVDGNILTGATTKDFPIYEVELQGINIIEVTPLFEVLGSIATTNSHFTNKLNELNRKLPACNEIYTGVANHAQYDIPDITPYDLLVIYGGPGTYANTSVVIPVESIVYKDDGQFALGVHQSSTTFWELEFNFPASTKINIANYKFQSWTTPAIRKILGIKL